MSKFIVAGIAFVLLGFLILFLTFAIYIYSNKEKLEADPLTYGAEVYDINYCSCVTNDNIAFSFDKEGIQQQESFIDDNNTTIFKTIP